MTSDESPWRRLPKVLVLVLSLALALDEMASLSLKLLIESRRNESSARVHVQEIA